MDGGGVNMTTRSDRIEARLLPEERAAIDRAAAQEGVSRSTFVLVAAVEKAERLIAEEATTRIPPSFFDDLLAALDTAAPARARMRARERTRRGPRPTRQC